ncbi:outer membrane lipoprotein-sorting protein [Elusimicrobium posterum]|uniref:LolA family protein n=1 Tax=Elusimicrobium posterum TaxID=3116653 RepID=UPI003C7389EC
MKRFFILPFFVFAAPLISAQGFVCMPDANVCNSAQMFTVSVKDAVPAFTVDVPAVKIETVKETAAVPVKEEAKVDAAAKLQEWDTKLKNLKTDFLQSTYFEDVKLSSSKGRIYYKQAEGKKPVLLRLDQLDEEGNPSQIALTDKKDIKIYDANMQPVTSLKWSDWQSGQSNAALFDFGNYKNLINTHRTVEEVTMETSTKLVLAPKDLKEDQDDYRLTIVVSNTDYFPLSIELNMDGMRTVAVLEATHKNLGLEKNTFGSFEK